LVFLRSLSINTYGTQESILQKSGGFLMPFPLPEDPEYRKLVVTFWLDDIDDHLAINQVQHAEKSWSIANDIYLSLPPGEGDPEIENWIFNQRVKLDKITSH
jgi:hypothetical protein